MSETESIFCPIRKAWVAALPEELVRQRFITYMTEERGFPASLISVEKSLRQLPHLALTDSQHIPDRRADILCFAKGVNGVYPLLLVECKAVKLIPTVVSQIVGYNHHVGASFIAVVNQTEMRVGWFDKSKREYVFLNTLPTYVDLLNARQET